MGTPYLSNLVHCVHVFHVPFSSLINYFQSPSHPCFVNVFPLKWRVGAQLCAERHLINAFNHNDLEAGLFFGQQTSPSLKIMLLMLIKSCQTLRVHTV